MNFPIVREETLDEHDTWENFFPAFKEFGKWKKTKKNGYVPGHRKVRIGIRKASNIDGVVVFSYMDLKNPKSCGVIRFPLIELKRLINKYEKSQLVKET